MPGPINPGVPHGGVRQPTPATPFPPPDSPALDQAAAEFAALLGAEPREAPTRDEGPTSREDAKAENTDSDSDAGAGPTDRTSGDRRTGRRDDRRRDEDARDDQAGDEEDSSAPGVETVPPSPGDAILQGLTRTAHAAPAEAAPAAGGSLENLVQQVADKILVSDPAASGGVREVRITLRESVLPGAEIRILQDGGKLQVQFRTDNSRAQEMLQQHQSSLQAQLNERLGRQDVVVDVMLDSQDQQPQDGRSRQQRDIQSELEQQREPRS